ncbi:MAG: hypothetical protein CBC38_07350 [Gammaproteobacteria bacterium TMED78]|nr:MAG: hypothetical protein CBC38_07350 [Gammaproteobacteria bacterium TMED78]|tara:strand:+ start:16682 stop:18991 length:2310 start_codon:yes stop_codon:yes gene_type:complete
MINQFFPFGFVNNLKPFLLFCIFILSLKFNFAYSFEITNIEIPYIDNPPAIEDFLDMSPSMEIKEKMQFATNFKQRFPNDLQPATESTEVYFAYDRENLYFIFLCFDSNPELIRANMAPREAIWDDDRIGLDLDTFNTLRSSYVFRSSPLGIQWDGRYNELSKPSGFDSSYEALWHSEGQLTDNGYVVKMTIPLKTLRFSEQPDQLWRIQFFRSIPRKSELNAWPESSRNIKSRIIQAALLSGISDVSPGRNIQIVPFLFSRQYDILDKENIGGSNFLKNNDSEIGLDAKFILRDSFVLDTTFNPDFSQVESDEPQVTVNERFEVLFPERRPFFIENSDYFNSEATLLFTRRIKDPSNGLRFTGQENGWGVGAMLVDDQAPGYSVSKDNKLFGSSAEVEVLRIFKDISEDYRLGFFMSDRTFGSRKNKVFSYDGRVNLNENWSTDIQLINSSLKNSEAVDKSGDMYNIRLDRQGNHLNVHTHYINVSEDFVADLAFLPRNYRPDNKSWHSRVSYNFIPESGFLNQWGPSIFVNKILDQNSLDLYEEFIGTFTWKWDGYTELKLDYYDTKESLRPEDHNSISSIRNYKYNNFKISFSSKFLTNLFFNFDIAQGEAINLLPAKGKEPEIGDTDEFTLGITWKPFGQLNIDTSILQSSLKDKISNARIFNNEIMRAKLNYQFSKEISLRFIAQKDITMPSNMTSLENTKGINYDLLFRYVINPWSAFYVGYNYNSSNFQVVDTENGRELIRVPELYRDGEQFFIKFSYLFQP